MFLYSHLVTLAKSLPLEVAFRVLSIIQTRQMAHFNFHILHIKRKLTPRDTHRRSKLEVEGRAELLIRDRSIRCINLTFHMSYVSFIPKQVKYATAKCILCLLANQKLTKEGENYNNLFVVLANCSIIIAHYRNWTGVRIFQRIVHTRRRIDISLVSRWRWQEARFNYLRDVPPPP